MAQTKQTARRRRPGALACALAVVAGHASSAEVRPSGRQLPGLWFWGSGSNESIDAIAGNQSLLRGAQVYYSVGAGSVNASNAHFVKGGDKALIARMRGKGWKVHSIVGCGSITTLRSLFADPQPFISGAIENAVELGLDGYNLDFEPYDSPIKIPSSATNADGLAYAGFMRVFAEALHQHDLELSVDYFSNLAIWNLAAMNSSNLDTIISMDTYAQDNNTMEAYTQVAYGYVTPSKVGMGICPQPSPTNKPYGPDPCGPLPWTDAMVAERLGYLAALMADDSTAFRMMNMCCSGIISPTWWKGLGLFYASLATRSFGMGPGTF